MARRGKFYLNGTTRVEIDNQSFGLSPIDENGIKSLRKSLSGHFLVLKEGELFYYTVIPKDISLNRGDGDKHLCKDCKRCYCLPKEQGGCQKVLDGRYGKRIEEYDFIKEGVETIAREGATYFVVLKCDNYGYESNSCKLTRKQQEEKMLAFIQVLYPDVENLKEADKSVRERKNFSL